MKQALLLGFQSEMEGKRHDALHRKRALATQRAAGTSPGLRPQADALGVVTQEGSALKARERLPVSVADISFIEVDWGPTRMDLAFHLE